MAKKKKPPPLTETDWERVFRLRCQSKRGYELNPTDHRFCLRALKENPERYGKMEKDVFEATKPFGA